MQWPRSILMIKVASRRSIQNDDKVKSGYSAEVMI